MTVAQPVISAGKRKLPQMMDAPDMRDAIMGSCRPMEFQIVTLKSGPGGDAVETSVDFKTDGFAVPVDPRKLDLQSDGTRRWKSYMLFTLTQPLLTVQDKVVIEGLVYKVMKAWDFSEFGFYKFGIVEDFQG